MSGWRSAPVVGSASKRPAWETAPVATATGPKPPPISTEQFSERFDPVSRGVPVEGAPPTGPGAMLQDFERGMSAGGQGTSPYVRDMQGNLNYQPIGEAQYGDDGNLYVNEGGKPRLTDRNREVALTDPQTGRLMVYARSSETAENAVTSAARVALPGMVSMAPTRLPAGVQAARRGMYPGAPGAVTGPAAGTRLTAPQVAEAFERSNIDPSVATVYRNRGVSGVARALNETVAGTPISRSFARQADQAAARAEEIAGTRSSVGQRSIAGENVQGGIEVFRDVTAPARQEVLYGRARELMQSGARSSLPTTLAAIGRIEASTSNAAVRKFITDKNYQGLVKVLRQAGTDGLTFDDLRQLRTQVRQLRPAEGTAVGINKVAVNRLYDALTKDMLALAEESGGPSAVHAIQRADQYTRALETVRLPALQPILDSKSGENAFHRIMTLAQQGAGANWRQLAQVKRSIGADWDDVSATVIREMGNPTPGSMASVDLDQFSPATFMTNFNKLSPQGKNTLFGARGGSELRDALENLVTAVGEMKRVHQLGNPSGTARIATANAMLVGLWFEPVSTVSILGSGHLLSAAMASPRLVRWLTATTRAATRGNSLAMRYQLNRLPGLVGQDQEMEGMLRRLISAEGDAASQPGLSAPAAQYQ